MSAPTEYQFADMGDLECDTEGCGHPRRWHRAYTGRYNPAEPMLLVVVDDEDFRQCTNPDCSCRVYKPGMRR